MISSFIRYICGWWYNATIGTQWFTFLNGKKVGEDDQGNIYYVQKKGRKRWVIYNGEIEASRIPPEWHAWLHYTVQETPVERPPVVQTWEKDHEANKTGSIDAYYPKGSLNEGATKATGDYEAWTPQ